MKKQLLKEGIFSVILISILAFTAFLIKDIDKTTIDKLVDGIWEVFGKQNVHVEKEALSATPIQKELEIQTTEPTIPDTKYVKPYKAPFVDWSGLGSYNSKQSDNSGNIGKPLQENIKNEQESISLDEISQNLSDKRLLVKNFTYDNSISQVNMSYDASNRILTKNVAGMNTAYAYDERYNGTLSNVTFGNSTYKYEYDDRLRVTREIKIIDGIEFEKINYYDSMDRLAKQEFMPGEDVEYKYNDQNKLSVLVDFISSTFHNEFDNILNRIYDNDKVTEFTHDSQNGRLLQIKTDAIQQLDYFYDKVGNIIAINDSANNRSYDMTYDFLDRLVNATIGTIKFAYSYNAIGNIMKIVRDGVSIIEFGYGNPIHAPDQIIVKNTNRAPTIDSLIPLNNTIFNETDIITIAVSATDPDNDKILYSIRIDEKEISTNYSYQWITSYEDAGLHRINATVSDGELTDIKEHTIIINDIQINRAPMLEKIGNKQVNENQTLTFLVNATDPDNDTLEYSVSGLPSGAAFVSQIFTWTPTFGQRGNYEVTFYVSDGELNSSETILITVVKVNRPPVLHFMHNVTVNESDIIEIVAHASDPDNDSLTYSINDTRFSQNQNAFTFHTHFGDAGSFSVKLTVSDGELIDSQEVFVTINALPKWKVEGVINVEGRKSSEGIVVTLDSLTNATGPEGKFTISNSGKVRLNLSMHLHGYLSPLPIGIALTPGDVVCLTSITLIAGDVDDNRFIETADMKIVSKALNSINVLADINGDGKVDVTDLALVGKNLGKNSSSVETPTVTFC